MPSDLVSVARHDNDNDNTSDDTNPSHHHESDTLSSLFTAPPSPSPSPPCSRSTSPCRPQHRHRARDNYCCGLLAPVDVESACPSPSHRPHAHSHSLQPHHQHHHISGIGPGTTFWTSPLLGPLLFSNDSSDARDHAANERTFLSYLRLSTYMAVVSVAITLSFHLKSQPTDVELRMARPLGLVFWLLAVACLALGFGNYVNTLNKYSRKAAIVQTGWRTQSVRCVGKRSKNHVPPLQFFFLLRGLPSVARFYYTCHLHVPYTAPSYPTLC